MKRIILTLYFSFFAFLTSSYANEITIAVASNFAPTLKKIIKQYSKSKIIIIVGSTGHLYSQIKHGYKFDLFFAADIRSNLLNAKKSFIYAKGKLVLWPNPNRVIELNNQNLNLKRILLKTTGKIAIANPKLAPYGKASIMVLKKLNILKKLQSKIVYGQNVSQVFQFVRSGNVDYGFLSLAQYLTFLSKEKKMNNKFISSSILKIPKALYLPINQEVLLLSSSEKALDFYLFLKNKQIQIQKLILASGYTL